MEIYEQLRILRKSKKIGQNEMAKACGVSKNAISLMETGQVRLRLDILLVYVRTLHVSLDFLLGCENIAEDCTTDKELLRVIFPLSEDKKKELLRMAKLLASSDTPDQLSI